MSEHSRARPCRRWWPAARPPNGLERARAVALDRAVPERGVTTFDHADIYGGYSVEALFGEALALAPHLRARVCSR